jgi:hypothetical protein
MRVVHHSRETLPEVQLVGWRIPFQIREKRSERLPPVTDSDKVSFLPVFLLLSCQCTYTDLR